MKKFTVLASLVLAIFVSLNANAQRLPSSLVHDHGVLVDENGKALTSQQVAYVIGKDLYDETYRGACKQYKMGKGLVLGGAIGTGVGVAAMIGSSVALANGDIKVRDTATATKRLNRWTVWPASAYSALSPVLLSQPQALLPSVLVFRLKPSAASASTGLPKTTTSRQPPAHTSASATENTAPA